MLLCLDVGNTHIFGGVFVKNKLCLRFRHATYGIYTSDQFGIFLKNVLRENNLGNTQITAIAISSVVPSIDYSLNAACKKYFQISPFVLHAGVKTGITLKITTPSESGADIIAGIIAACDRYPQKDLIIFDFGTVTTAAVVTKNKEYLGSIFIPGMYTAMNSLQSCAANLFPVEIIYPKNIIGRSTKESMQSGLYFGQLGSIKEIVFRVAQEVFAKDAPICIATGGFAHLFEHEKIFDLIEPDLILHGIRLVYNFNQSPPI